MMTYLLFAGDTYYPSGGAEDFRCAFGSIDEAKIAKPDDDWAHIATFVGKELKIVARYERYWSAHDQAYMNKWAEE